MHKTFSCNNDEKIISYVENLFKPEDQILHNIRERITKDGLPEIQVSPFDGLILELITRACGAKKIIEIGTLGGYSSIYLARGLPENGKLYTCELQHKNVEFSKKSFYDAGLSHKIEIHQGPALQTLEKLKIHAPFDLVFIDADKSNYVNYFHWAKANLRVGGVILADNTFAWGMIADQNIEDEVDKKHTLALRHYNETVAKDTDFRSTILPTGEGLTFSVKIK